MVKTFEHQCINMFENKFIEHEMGKLNNKKMHLVLNIHISNKHKDITYFQKICHVRESPAPSTYRLPCTRPSERMSNVFLNMCCQFFVDPISRLPYTGGKCAKAAQGVCLSYFKHMFGRWRSPDGEPDHPKKCNACSWIKQACEFAASKMQISPT